MAIKAIAKKNLAKSQNLLGKEIKILKVRLNFISKLGFFLWKSINWSIFSSEHISKRAVSDLIDQEALHKVSGAQQETHFNDFYPHNFNVRRLEFYLWSHFAVWGKLRNLQYSQ